MTERLGVVGIWHLGSSITASWLRLGRAVTAVDFNAAVVAGLREGCAPLFEPGLDDALKGALADGRLQASDDPRTVAGCAFVFIAYDTPVRDDDTSDLAPILQAIEACGPHLDPGATVIVSAQLPVGTARRLRTRLQALAPGRELVYSPENLRLGEALRCYLEPGHIVIGAEDAAALDRVEALFAPMKARVFRMNLPSAEMTKHAINTFLATSVTLANQWADVCGATGADFADVAAVLRTDPRIGERAYITPGIGFSGGTLGRDLRVLEEVSRTALGGGAPLFGEVWRYNQRRVEVVARRAEEILGGAAEQRIALLGMTYKPGTSTLRRSLPLAVALDLLSRGAAVRAHDPKADWREVAVPEGLVVADSPYAAAEDADLVVLLTEWPEYRELDFARLRHAMARPLLLDTKGFLRPRADALAAAGLRLLGLAPGPGESAA
jgi:UDPglucose 6-dehydrogenase